MKVCGQTQVGPHNPFITVHRNKITNPTHYQLSYKDRHTTSLVALRPIHYCSCHVRSSQSLIHNALSYAVNTLYINELFNPFHGMVYCTLKLIMGSKARISK